MIFFQRSRGDATVLAGLLGSSLLLVACGPAGGGVASPTQAPQTEEPAASTASDTQTATATLEPTAEPTPEVTESATFSAVPTVEPSAQPSPWAPTPTDGMPGTEDPNFTEDPQGTEGSTPTPTATATATATATMVPTPVPTAIPTPLPTAVPTVAPTPVPTAIPEPTAPANLEGTGNDKGDVAYDFSLRDETGTYMDLYDFYGDVILLEFSAIWCGTCNNHAQGAEETYQKYKEQGFTSITILVQNQQAQQPSTSDLSYWVDKYELTFPVLADEAGLTHGQYGFPTFPGIYILDREMKITEAFTNGIINDAVIEAAIEEEL